MERMGDILAKVAGRRASLQSKTRRTTSVRKKPGVTSAASATGAQKTPLAPAPERQQPPTEAIQSVQVRAPHTTPMAQTKISARPAAQASAPIRQPQPVRRPPARALPDAIESVASPASSTGPARVAPDAEPILEMPTRRRTPTASTPSGAPTPAQNASAAQASPTPTAYAADAMSGASLRLNSAALRASVSSVSSISPTPPTPQATTRPSAPARPVAQTPQQASTQPVAQRPSQPTMPPIQDASPASVGSVARTRSNGRPPAAGMLPLGAAAQGFLAAMSAHRQQSSQATQAPDVADAPQQRTTGRKSAQLTGATAQPIGYGAPEEDVCPICGGMGYVRMDVPVGDPMFGQAAPCECKERQREERRRSDLHRISSLDAFDKKTFETFDYRAAPAARDALEIARRYADDPQGWLILSGGYGVGKTHLAAAIANYQLSRGRGVFFSIVPDLLDHLRAAFAPSSESPFDETFDRVREAGLLVLDDLGAENSTAWATEKLFQLINYRYNYRMPTVITTNHRLLSHIDERINSRLSDLSLARHVAIDAPDYRQRHAGRPAPTRGRSGPRG